jgi:hypothetical protein
MGNKDQEYAINGLVVLYDVFFGGKTKGKKRGRGTEKINVLVAVSLSKEERRKNVICQDGSRGRT